MEVPICMGLSIIHFSDIHIKGENDFIYKQIEKLKKACVSDLTRNNDVVLLISGDIAFSGKLEEYKVAKQIIEDVSQYIETETQGRVYYIFVPGNHDCNFSEDNSVRNILIDSLNSSEITNAVIESINSVQCTYEEFIDNYGLKTTDLISTKSISSNNEDFLFIMINSAWMSKYHEEKGRIIIPESSLPKIDTRNYRAIFSVLHHPIGWFDNYKRRPFIEFIRNTTDILFVGHEHEQDQYTQTGSNWGLTEFHAKELQNSYSIDSQFSVINFDDLFQTYDWFEYAWNKDKYIRKNKRTNSFIKNPLTYKNSYYPNDKMLEFVNDIGININHFNSENIYLSDLFVWPELLKRRFDGEVNEVKIKENIFEEIISNKISIVVGESLSGKTSLSKRIFVKCIENGLCCLYSNDKDFTTCNESKLNDVIENIFINNFNKNLLDDFLQLEKSKKTIIIDGFDDIKYVGAKKNRILQFILERFDTVILTVSSDFELPQLLSSECIANQTNVPIYEILPLGNRKRMELVQKWYSIGKSLDTKTIEQRVEKSIIDIDTILGNGAGFMPANPVFILNILQNDDSFSTSSFNGSQYCFLYETLIKKSLSAISDNYKESGAYNIDTVVLSKVAFEMLINKTKTFNKAFIERISITLSEKLYIDINSEQVVDRMIKAKILYKEIEQVDEYRFRYPYMFYYFCGRHIAYNLVDPEVQKQIEYMNSKLYIESYGNIIIFVCHFSNNIEIIESILLNAYSTLENYEPFKFENNNSFVNDMETVIETLLPNEIGDNSDVKENNEKRLANLDAAGINDGKAMELDSSNIDEEPFSEKEKDLIELSAAFKTLDVLGQILRNYPGDIDGTVKVDIIKEIHDLGMRSVQATISAMELIQDDFVNMIIEKAKKENKTLQKEKLVIDTKKLFTFLLSGLVRCMINKIALSINSKYLLKAAQDTFDKNNSISENLVLQDLKFNCLKEPNLSEIFSLYERLNNDNNIFGICVLKSIVANYLTYNECDFRLRNRLCSKFELNSKSMIVSQRKALALND